MSAFTLVYTRALEITWYSDDVNIPYPNVVKAGTNTSVNVNQLIDSSADFNGIQIGDIVLNSSADQVAYVVGFINSTTLLLSDNIFTSGGDNYKIFQGQNEGCYLYVPTQTAGATIEVETIGGDIVRFSQPPVGIIPVQVRKIFSGTDAVNLVALW